MIKTGQDMREARQAMGLTQTDTALLLGMPRPALSDIERESIGRRPTRQQSAHMAALSRLYVSGLLAGYLAEIKKNEGGGK